MRLTQNKCLSLLLRLACWAAAAALTLLALKYLLPWLAPFLLALLTAALIEPAVRCMTEKCGIKRSFASALCSFAILALICAAAVVLTGRAAYELTGFARDLPSMLSGLPELIASAETKIDKYIVSAPPEIREYLTGAVSNLSGKITELPAELTGRLLSLLSSAASAAPKLLLFVITYAVGVFFISGSYIEIKSFLMRQVPGRHRERARSVKAGMTDTLVKWLKAQVMLMCITFLLLTASFLLIRIDYAAFLALFVSIVDALPVFGVGTVLLPWAAVALLLGDGARAASLAVIYAVVTVARNFLQPRLVGGMLGVHQVPMLIAMYVGFCAAGVGGMIVLPVLLVAVKQLADMGCLKLWK